VREADADTGTTARLVEALARWAGAGNDHPGRSGGALQARSGWRSGGAGWRPLNRSGSPPAALGGGRGGGARAQRRAAPTSARYRAGARRPGTPTRRPHRLPPPGGAIGDVVIMMGVSPLCASGDEAQCRSGEDPHG
jgi:hypothetical protein